MTGITVTGAQWLERARAINRDLVRWRRHVHQHPEVSFAEAETTRYLAAELGALGATTVVRRRETGLWLDIEGGGGPGPTVLVRADIDALPVQEETGLPFASANDGAMHACGHDAHTAIGLGVACLLMARRAEFRGRVRVLFQPAEEQPPGGAPTMIEAGCLDGVDSAIALHVFAQGSAGAFPTGKVFLAAGPVLAASGRFAITIRGRGGHGSAPHLSVDAIAVAGEVLSALQHVRSRRLDPLAPAVLTVGTIHGGFVQNVIAPTVEMTGTVRTFDPAVEDRLVEAMRTIVTHTAAAFGAEADVVYEKGYPVVVNDATATAVMQEAVDSVLGPGAVSQTEPIMGSEDFAYYGQRVPSVFLGLGAAAPGVEAFPNHHPRFAADEAALPLGVAILCDCAMRLMARGAQPNA